MPYSSNNLFPTFSKSAILLASQTNGGKKMFNTMNVAKKIKEARISQNMTQMNLADIMEVSYQAVSNWERGVSHS